MKAYRNFYRLVFAGILLLGGLLPAVAQNTKGDQPLSNQRQVRETRIKTIKKRERARTRDISGRRLRTKNTSSANRANASYPQVSPYRNRKRVNNDVPAAPRTPIYSRPPRERQRAWTGDIAGKAVRRVEPRKTEAARNNVYPARGPYVNNPSPRPREPQRFRVSGKTASGKPLVRRMPRTEQRAWKGNMRGNAVVVRSATGRTKNVFSQRGPYTAFGRLQQPSDRSKQYWNQGIVSRILSTPARLIRGQRYSPSVSDRSRVTPGRKNVYWGKIQRKERALSTDLASRPLRARNFRSATPGVASQDTLRLFGRSPGLKRLRWNATGKAGSASRQGKAWQGDLAGRAVRFRQPRAGHAVQKPLRPLYPGTGSWAVGRGLRRTKGNKPVMGGGSASGKLWNNNGRPVDVNTAGTGTIRGSLFSGTARGQRPMKGGGSISGKLWNNNGRPVDVNTAGTGTIRGSLFSGTVRGQRPMKGGGSISGKLWNNNGRPVDVNTAGTGTIRGSPFSGTTRGQRPLTGGGSVSSRPRNNGNQPVDVIRAGRGTVTGARYRGKIDINKLWNFADQGGEFTGFIKAKKPEKGGGTISGKLWNNNGRPVDVNTAGTGTIRASQFAGTIRGKRPLSGGGSISGKLWNNNGRPIEVNTAGTGTIRASQFAGTLRGKRPISGGESISGKLWNNNETPLDPRIPGSNDAKMVGYSGFAKMKRGHQQNPNAHKSSIEKRTPSRYVAEADGLQTRIRQRETGKKEVTAEGVLPGLMPSRNLNKAYAYQGTMKQKNTTHNPSAAEDALKVIAPSASFRQASTSARGTRVTWGYAHSPSASSRAIKTIAPTRTWNRATSFAGNTRSPFDYRHNPNSHDLALNVRYYGKAYAKIERYRGEMKVVRYTDGRLHPDARFAHGRPPEPTENRSFFTQVQLWWSKNFKPADAQPDHLKERVRKPRYDKREIGLWYD